MSSCQLVLITNRKSHTGFRLVPTLMTLNDFERRNSLYFVIFYRIPYSFTGRLRHSGWRWTYTVSRISSSTFDQNWPTLQRGLSGIAELLVICACTLLVVKSWLLCNHQAVETALI